MSPWQPVCLTRRTDPPRPTCGKTVIAAVRLIIRRSLSAFHTCQVGSVKGPGLSSAYLSVVSELSKNHSISAKLAKLHDGQGK